MTQCPCGSTKSFDVCCGAYHAGQPAPTAEALMRSRYAAYVVGDLDYIEKTSAGEARLRFDRTDLLRSQAGTEWLGLEIVDRQDGGVGDEAGTVTFRARFRQDGREQVLSEKSEFRHIGSEWRYVSGEATASMAGKTGRNDPCPCGSGRKYKKCHGAG